MKELVWQRNGELEGDSLIDLYQNENFSAPMIVTKDKNEFTSRQLNGKKSDKSDTQSDDSVFIEIKSSWFSNLDSSETPSTGSGYSFFGGTENLGSQHSFIVELQSSSSSISLEKTGTCVVCQKKPNTCVVHTSDSHFCFCIDCAGYFFRNGGVCPLCNQKIVYIYMYTDI